MCKIFEHIHSYPEFSDVRKHVNHIRYSFSLSVFSFLAGTLSTLLFSQQHTLSHVLICSRIKLVTCRIASVYVGPLDAAAASRTSGSKRASQNGTDRRRSVPGSVSAADPGDSSGEPTVKLAVFKPRERQLIHRLQSQR